VAARTLGLLVGRRMLGLVGLSPAPDAKDVETLGMFRGGGKITAVLMQTMSWLLLRGLVGLVGLGRGVDACGVPKSDRGCDLHLRPGRRFGDDPGSCSCGCCI
jgi:hypothetical protein